MEMTKEILATEAELSKIAGYAVEITPRNEAHFTVSFDAVDQNAARRLARFFSDCTSIVTDVTSHMPLTCLYIEV